MNYEMWVQTALNSDQWSYKALGVPETAIRAEMFEVYARLSLLRWEDEAVS